MEPEEREAALVRAKMGEFLTRVELAEDLIEKGAHEPMEDAQGMRRPLCARTWRRYLLLAYRLARSSVYAAAAPAGILTT